MANTHTFETPAANALNRLPRQFSAFDLPPGFERVRYTLEVRGRVNGIVVLTSDATGPWREKPPLYQSGRRIVGVTNGRDDRLPGPMSQAELHLTGDGEAGAMFASFFDGDCTLGIVADWIEDDVYDRVKLARAHMVEAHRLHPDTVTHFLLLMRCYRDRRRSKR